MPVPVRRYLRKTPKRPPIKIVQAPKPKPKPRNFPAEYNMDAFEAMEKWHQWQGWTLEPFKVQGPYHITYIKSYGPSKIFGRLIDDYSPEEDKHYYSWELRAGPKLDVIRKGEGASLWAVRTKADKVFKSLPYVAGWNAAVKGRKMRQGKNKEWAEGYMAAKAYILRITGGGSAPAFDPDAEAEWG